MSSHRMICQCALVLAICPLLFAQRVDRLKGPVDTLRLTVAGSRNPRLETMQDEGALEPGAPVRGLGLRFKPSAERLADLQQLLEQQQDPASPLYHAWLTPEEFGDRFGLSPHDLARVREWVEGQGFEVEYTARSRTFIQFSGRAEQVRHTFRTELHRFRKGSRTGYANTSEVHVPADLEPLIYNVTGLDELPAEPRSLAEPRINANDPSHLLGPGDLATIYNVTPLLQNGFDGSGQSIVVPGKSAIKVSDIQAYRKLVGLPKHDPTVILVPGAADPGESDEFAEATGDVEVAGAAAPNASIIFVYAANAFAAAAYATDQQLAPVISFSYGICEKMATLDPRALAAERAVVQQANAQGITYVASSGDTGAASCESQRTDFFGTSGISMNVPATFPEVTAVGGTLFEEGARSFWAGGNSWGSTALSYIPEVGWNDTPLGKGLAASGGGASVLYPKPSWQTGPGVPNVNARVTPDISFAASYRHDPYLIVLDGKLLTWGGTSAATPFFAGVIAILNQYLAANAPQERTGLGNVNPRLYELARTAPAVFHDITVGDNVVPCKAASPDCATGQYGYTAGPGWDAVTGLGSLDVNEFVLNWARSSSGVTTTAIAVTADPARISRTGSTSITATVKAAGSAALPAGLVRFAIGQAELGSVDLSAQAGAAVARLTVSANQLTAGVNTIAAHYGGSSTFASSTGMVTVTVGGGGSDVSVVADPPLVYPDAPDEDGYIWHYKITLREAGGVATKVTSFTIDGVDYTSDFPVWFSGADLPAGGTLTAYMRSKNLPTPASHVFTFRGADADGQTWTRSVTVTLVGENAGRISLSSLPATVRADTQPDPRCSAAYPVYQQLLVQELNGKEVRLTKFVAAGGDLTSRIPRLFGSARVAAFGALAAGMCWKFDAFPASVSYELNGVDASGAAVGAKLQVTFSGPAQDAGPLTVSKGSLTFEVPAGGSVKADLDVMVPDGEQWSLTLFPATQKSQWLRISPPSGTGPGQVTVTASAENVPPGIYTAHLIFQSVHTRPQYVDVPVAFEVGSMTGGAITGAQNAASYQVGFAPGMLTSIYGNGLANTTRSAPSVPLPLTLDGVAVTVDGIPAPLWFISPGQINIQLPYETRTGRSLVVVNNNGQVSSLAIQVTAAAPGIFNQSGAIAPSSAAKRGAAASIYITGDGEATPMMETGAPPQTGTTPDELPKPVLPVTVSVGGIPAEVKFIGNPFLVGVTQINFEIPANAPLGAQAVVVTVGTAPSAAQTIVIHE